MRLLTRPHRQSEDGAAIARSHRDPEAFAAVFDRHYVSVYRYIVRRAGRDLADDLASQTFTLAFAHRGRYRDDLGTARPWLFGIATNLLRAERRDADRRLAVLDRLASETVASSSEPSLSATGSVSQDDDRLGTALQNLRADQLDALVLHAWGELSYAEVAAALDVPIGTVRSRISRACAVLRKELDNPAAVAGERSHGV